MKTHNEILTNNPAGAFVDGDIIVLGRGGLTYAGLASALRTYVRLGQTITASQISDSGTLGRTILATEADIISTPRIRLTATTAPGTLADGQVWVQSDKLTTRLAGASRTVLDDSVYVPEVVTLNNTVMTPFFRNKQVFVDTTSAAKQINFLGATGFSVGDTITILNTPGANDVTFFADTGVTFLGNTALVAPSGVRVLRCTVSAGAVQTWLGT